MASTVEIPMDYDIYLYNCAQEAVGVSLPSSYTPEALADLLARFEGKSCSPEVERVVDRLQSLGGASVDTMNLPALIAAQLLELAWLSWERRLAAILKGET